MRIVFGLVLILGLALAGSAVYLVQGYLNQNTAEIEDLRAQLEQRVDTTEIYVASVPLRYGEELTPELVRTAKFPSDSLPEGVFSDPAVLFPNDNATPRMVLRAIEPNEPLLAVKMTDPGEDAGLTTMLTPGMVAFTIPVDASSGVSGFVHPGDRVDIYWSGSAGASNTTLRLDTNVLVIAVDQSFDRDDRTTRVPSTVTVEGTPQQAANFRAAQAAGRLSLALRGVGDATTGEVIEVDINDVLGREVIVPEVVQEERKCYVTVRQGAEEVQREVRCPEEN